MTGAAAVFFGGGDVTYTAGPRLGATLTVTCGDGEVGAAELVVGAAVLLTGSVSAGE
ncbi:hypothetical protein Abr02nite_37200 [Paractinoplanes brasiliensis]|nr:hypothetical protein Abr02nite_37200 [Actinoplanes brasiliensis]